MSERKGVEPEPMSLEILDKKLFDYLNLDPEGFKKLYIDNLIKISMSQLIGWSGKQSLKVKCDSAGRLLISISESGFENYKWIVTTGISAEEIIDIGSVASHIFIECTNAAAEFSLSTDNVSYGDVIPLPNYAWFDLDMQHRYIKLDTTSGTPDVTILSMY